MALSAHARPVSQRMTREIGVFGTSSGLERKKGPTGGIADQASRRGWGLMIDMINEVLGFGRE